MVNKIKKGDRFERKIKKSLEKQGYIVYKPTRTKFSTQKDIFNLFDLLAWNPKNKQLIFIQAKDIDYTPSETIKNLKKFKPLHILVKFIRKNKDITIYKI